MTDTPPAPKPSDRPSSESLREDLLWGDLRRLTAARIGLARMGLTDGAGRIRPSGLPVQLRALLPASLA